MITGVPNRAGAIVQEAKAGGYSPIQHNTLPTYGQIRPEVMSLMAFEDKMGFALGLGIVRSITSESMELLTPLSELSDVAGLHFGSLQLDPFSGQEL
ncbi:MAG: hypothetical protein ABIK98_01120 [Pseudomonadota bacterium]